MEAAILHREARSHAALFALYTRILRHWTSLLFANETIPPHASETISALVQHVNHLAQTISQSSPTVASEAFILDFYEQLVRLVSDNTLRNHIKIELPPPSLIYTLLFSTSLQTVSRLCRTLALFKKGFETAMSSRSVSYKRPYVNMYNGFLMDICNCLWRSRAFSDADSNAVGCLIPRPVVAILTEYVSSVDNSAALVSLFGVSYSHVLCYQSIQCVRDMEDEEMAKGTSIQTRHAGPVTQASLARLAVSGGMELSWQEYRIRVLESLGAKGFPGVAELLKSTMTTLKNAMEGRASSTQTSR